MSQGWDVIDAGVKVQKSFYLTYHGDIGLSSKKEIGTPHFFVLQHGEELPLLFSLLKYDSQSAHHGETVLRGLLPSFDEVPVDGDVQRTIDDLFEWYPERLPVVSTVSDAKLSKERTVRLSGANFNGGYVAVVDPVGRLCFVDVKGAVHFSVLSSVSFQASEVVKAVPSLFQVYLEKGLTRPASNLKCLFEKYYE